LAELLLAKGYAVHGIVRRASMFNRSRIDHLRLDPSIGPDRLALHYADLHDSTTLRRLLHRLRPDELYHLAGQSHVGLSFEIPESTCQEIAHCTLALLEICRDLSHPVRFYHASSSEIFGRPVEHDVPQNESTPFRPTSPYGCAKAFATNLCQVYRESYGMFVCSGISYNHESPRRGENFVTRKISLSAARIKAGLQEELSLGNLSAARDWGYAAEYVDAMWRMIQAAEPRDYVIATGAAHTVRDFVCAAFSELGITLVFEGTGAEELGRDSASGLTLVRVDARFFRPADPDRLIGDPRRLVNDLQWQAKIMTPELAALMARADFGELAGSN